MVKGDIISLRPFKEVNLLKDKNNEFQIAVLSEKELTSIKNFEEELDDKYYIIAFER